MLESVKDTIAELPDISFWEYYQNYICDVQDRNILQEIRSIKTEEILSVSGLLNKLHS